MLYPTGIETADCNPSTTTSASPHINDRIQLVDIKMRKIWLRASIKSDSFKPCYQRCSQHARIVPALWKHCDDEQHSWAEAVKRMLWQAEQLEAMPLLPPDKLPYGYTDDVQRPFANPSPSCCSLLYPTGIETADCTLSTTTSASPHIRKGEVGSEGKCFIIKLFDGG